MSVINGVTTAFVGNHYEVSGGVATKYRCNGKSSGKASCS